MRFDGVERPGAKVGREADGVDHVAEFALEQRRVAPLGHPGVVAQAAQALHEVAADEAPATQHGEAALSHGSERQWGRQ